MSIGSPFDIERLATRTRPIWRAVFGDRIGAILFVGACLFYGLLWQVGFFLNDTWTIANALVGVAEGHLYIDRVVYGSYLQTPGVSPGTHVVGQRVYGRNYGQVFFALPFLWAMQLLSLFADPRILLAALWSLGLVLFGHQLGTLLDRYSESLVAACLLALGLFGVNVWLALPLDPRWIPHLSLQLSTIVAAGVVVVVLYRLVELVADRRTATTLAAAAAVGTPIAFWATLPKRHSLSALLVLLTVYLFARSRAADDAQVCLRFRALAYVPVGLLAWVHAAEALSTFIALLAVDMLTARSNKLKDLGTVAMVFAVSLLPFALTNAIVTGDPLFPPRLWPNFRGTEPVILNGEPFNQPEGTTGPTNPESNGDIGQTTPGGGTTGGTSSPEVIDLTGLVSTAVADSIAGGQYLWNEYGRSFTLLTSDPVQFSQVFIRGGWAPYQIDDQQAINLTFLESMPLLGAAIALPAFVRRVPRRSPSDWVPERQIDLLVVAISIGFLLFNLQRLPIHASGTVRYLHPLVPLAVYAVARIPPIRAVLNGWLSVVGWSFTAGILIGSQLMIIGLASLVSSIGGAIQLHALVNLGFAALLAAWCLVAATGYDGDRFQATGAVVLGLTLATGTVTMSFLIANHLLGHAGPALGVGRLIQAVIPP